MRCGAAPALAVRRRGAGCTAAAGACAVGEGVLGAAGVLAAPVGGGALGVVDVVEPGSAALAPAVGARIATRTIAGSAAPRAQLRAACARPTRGRSRVSCRGWRHVHAQLPSR